MITRGGFEGLVVGDDVINAGSAVRSEAALRDRTEEFAPPEGANPFGAPPDPDTSQILYGQSAAFIDAVRPAAEVVRAISNEAELILNSRPRSLLS
ncbi:MAG: nitronate monooxygenase [Pseudonocardiales bacterium]|nr:nitronate monooxygenase [Pseudonocardiales bacterium]